MTLDFFDNFERDMWDLERESLKPLTNISETDDAIIIEIDLPLVRKEDIHLKLVENKLEVEASLERCVKFDRWGTVQRNCEFKSFYKLISLPNRIVIEGTKASFKRGILRIELKKRKDTEYRISIE